MKYERWQLVKVRGRYFVIYNKDRSFITCKFCHERTWVGRFDDKVYNPGGVKFHVDSCVLRKQHYKEQAKLNAERRRQRKPITDRDDIDFAEALADGFDLLAENGQV